MKKRSSIFQAKRPSLSNDPHGTRLPRKAAEDKITTTNSIEEEGDDEDDEDDEE
jgi:hypothetical protein